MSQQPSQTKPEARAVPLHFGRYQDIASSLAAQLHSELPASALRASAHLLVPSRSAASAVTSALLGLRPGGVAGIYFNTIELLASRIVNAAGHFPPFISETQRQILLRKSVEAAGHPLLAAHGIETMVGRSLRDLRDSGSSVNELAARLAARRKGAEDRHEAFIAAARLYEEYLRALGLIETHDLIGHAIRLLEEGATVEPQILFGFYDMTGLQQKLLEALMKKNLVIAGWLPIPVSGAGQIPEAYGYASAFVSRLRDSASDVNPITHGSATDASLTVRSLPTPRDEMREISRSIRRLLDDGVHPSTIGIVSRAIDPSQERIALQFAREFSFAIGIPRKRALNAHRIGRSIIRVLSLAGSRYPRGAVIELMRDGFLTDPVSNPREIDRVDRLTRRHRIAGGTPAEVDLAISGAEKRSGKPLSELVPYAEAVRDLDRVVSTIPPAGSGAEWSKLLNAFCARFRLRTADDIAAVEAIEELSRELDSLEKARVPILPREVARSIEGITISSAPDDKDAVWFGDVMRMRGLSFEHLFCFAMQEDRLPQRRIPDPILTDRDRTLVGLSIIGDGRAEEELLFQLMVDAVKRQGEFSFARADGFGKELRPSPLLPRIGQLQRIDLPADPAMDLFPRPLSEREQRMREVAGAAPGGSSPSESLHRKLRLAASVGARSRYDGYIDLDERLQAEIRRRLETISPSWFEDFGDCPQKFLFRRLLGADELENPEHEPAINQREKGGLDHRILERFYREADQETLFGFDAAATSSLPPELRELLRTIVIEEFAAFDQEYPPFNPRIRDLEREITLTSLERFIAGDIEEMAASGFRPAFYEFTFGPSSSREPDYPDAVAIALPSMEISVRGTIDRIDRKGEMYYRIIDYKAGTATRYGGIARRIDAGQKLQLALYALAAESLFEADPSRISGAIRPVGTDGRLKEGHTFELGQVRELLLENLNLFASAILEGRFPALPDDEGACRYCTMKLTCRSRHDPEDRRRMRRFANAAELLREESDD